MAAYKAILRTVVSFARSPQSVINAVIKRKICSVFCGIPSRNMREEDRGTIYSGRLPKRERRRREREERAKERD